MPDRELILIAEDFEDDVYLIRHALEKAGVLNPTQVVRSGEDAIAYLQGEGEFAHRDEYPLLKMPGTDGFQVLRWVRQQPGLKALRVIALTSSEDIRDVNHAYECGANSFLVKPMDFENSVEIGKFIKDYWLAKARAPAISRPPALINLRPDPR